MTFLWGTAAFPGCPAIRFTHIQVILGGKGHPAARQQQQGLPLVPPARSLLLGTSLELLTLDVLSLGLTASLLRDCAAHAVNSPAHAKRTSRAVLCMQKKLIVGRAAASRRVLHIPGYVEACENIFNHQLLHRAKLLKCILAPNYDLRTEILGILSRSAITWCRNAYC